MYGVPLPANTDLEPISRLLSLGGKFTCWRPHSHRVPLRRLGKLVLLLILDS
jgi:hypothetical protein